MIPEPWECVLLFGGVYRSWRLVALDTIMERPRMLLLRLLRQEIGGKADQFLLCPWCSGAWIALGWYGMWQWLPHATLVVAAPALISAAVGMLAKLDD